MEKRPEIGTAASAAPDAAARAAARDVAGADSGASTAAGGTGGALGGAAAGATAAGITLGPVGAVIGAIAGAVGGGWAGLSAGGGTDAPTDREDVWRSHYEGIPDRPADVTYDRVRPAYHLGYLAARNPDYSGRDFGSVERDLEGGWNSALRDRHGDWANVRAYAREAYEREGPRARGATFADRDMGGSATHHRASYSDPIPRESSDSVLRTSEEYARRPSTEERAGEGDGRPGERGRSA